MFLISIINIHKRKLSLVNQDSFKRIEYQDPCSTHVIVNKTCKNIPLYLSKTFADM